MRFVQMEAGKGMTTEKSLIDSAIRDQRDATNCLEGLRQEQLVLKSAPTKKPVCSIVWRHLRIAESMSDFSVVIPLPAFHLDDRMPSVGLVLPRVALHRSRVSRAARPMIPPNN